MKIILALFISTVVATSLPAQQGETNNAKSGPYEQIKKTNLQVVANYFHYLFKKGDFTSLARIVAKNAVYIQAEGVPYGGNYKGFGEWIKMFMKATTFYDLKIEKEPVFFTSASTTDVIISFSVRFKAKTTGKEIVMPLTEYFELKDGLIISVRPFYFDTKTFSETIK